MAIPYILAILLGLFLPVQANDFTTLRYMIKARDQEPKLYLPDTVIIGNDVNLLVVAPGAKKVELYGSSQAGETEINGSKLRLGNGAALIDSKEIQNGDRENFKFNLDKQKYADLINKFYMFEALVTYTNPLTGEDEVRNASFFGASASFTNNNAVKILPPPKDNAGLANMARSMIPGLNPVGGYR